MSWWDAILDTAVAAVGFLTDNAGDIATAVSTIGSIVSKVGESPQDDPLIGASIAPTLKTALENNEKHMRSAAYTLMHPTPPAGKPEPAPLAANETINNVFDYTGLIPVVTTDANGNAPDAISSDLNKLLSINDFPTSLTAGGVATDVGKDLAQQMVSSAKPVPSSAAPNANLQMANPISVGPDENGNLVNGMHVFYAVPMCGDQIGIQAWHSHVRLETAMPYPGQQAWKAKKRALALPPTIKKSAIGIPEPMNATTVSATWNTTAGVDEVMNDAVTSMDPKFQRGQWSQAGQKYIYQFQTDTSIGPAAVLVAFQAAIQAQITAKNMDMPTVALESQHTILT